MSNVKLKKVTLDLYDKDTYGSVVAIIEKTLDEVMKRYGSNIRGGIEFMARTEKENVHLVTYTMNSDRGCYKYYYDSLNVYCPLEPKGCDIRMVINAVDLNKTDYSGIAKDIIREIARKINKHIENDKNCEACYLLTIEQLVKTKNGTFTIDSVYAEADEIGILDARLVDKIIEKLLQENTLVEIDGKYRRRPTKNYVAVNIFANPAD
ncbi:hypothetical protein IKX12_00450 [Candidatus Saccharibacteria bacterium]|nr:hypothetical protein [Candidatus Saccharibacteria bacterium]